MCNKYNSIIAQGFKSNRKCGIVTGPRGITPTEIQKLTDNFEHQTHPRHSYVECLHSVLLKSVKKLVVVTINAR